VFSFSLLSTRSPPRLVVQRETRMMLPHRVIHLLAALPLTLALVVADCAESKARTRSPLSQFEASLNHLFSPPGRSRRAKAKRPAMTEPAESKPAKATRQDEDQGGGSRTGRKRNATPEPETRANPPQKEARATRSLPVTAAVPLPQPRPAEAPKARERAIASSKDRNREQPTQPNTEPRERTAALPPAKSDNDAAPPVSAPAPSATPAPSAAPSPAPASGAADPAAAEGPSPCLARLNDIAVAKPLPAINSGQCTAEDVVRLESVMGKDGQRVTLAPAATLRCPMAESVVHWVRDEVTSTALEFGAQLKSLFVDTSFDCRSRNHVKGAKLSEHGHANAIDLRGLLLANGRTIVLTDQAVDKEAREHLRQTACTRFTTVLGPGSDGYHENHIHLDIVERRSGYRICQWDVRDGSVVASSVPLPPERPAAAPPRTTTGKSSSRD
jgi:hypothetical protein